MLPSKEQSEVLPMTQSYRYMSQRESAQIDAGGGEHVREGRNDTHDGLEISVVVEVKRMPQLLPRPTYHSIDF